MIIRELYYFDKKTMEPIDDNRYTPNNDSDVVELDDTRKTRLTLKDINRSRKADEMHKKEITKDLEYVKRMYGLANQGTEQSL